MKTKDMPLNLDLLYLSPMEVKMTPAIEVLDTMEGVTKNFHPKGLFSTEIFGRVGDPDRTKRFARIELGLPICHPLLFKIIVKLKGLYGEVMAGKKYVRFDEETKDLVEVDALEGSTGMEFFMKTFPKIELIKKVDASKVKGITTKQWMSVLGGDVSLRRQEYVNLIEKFKDKLFLENLLVMPAGLRDLEVDETGRMTESELNDFYRQILANANLLKDLKRNASMEYLDTVRFNLQAAVYALYEHITELLSGKTGQVQSKFASRRVFNSTRNVLTSYVHNAKSLDDIRLIKPTQTVMGVYQTLRNMFPLSANLVKTKFLDLVFMGPTSPAKLVNKNTLKSESVQVKAKEMDSWVTLEGLEKKFALFANEEIRHLPIEIAGRYLGLLYESEGYFRFIQSVDEVPKELMETGDVRPVSLADIFYLSIGLEAHKYPTLVTRYPAINYGSVYPSYIYLKSTVKADIRTELGPDWQPTDITYGEYPIVGEPFFDAQSPNQIHLGRMGADYDGDTGSAITAMSEDAIEEVEKLLTSRNFFVDVNNNMYFSAETDITSITFKTLTFRSK